MMMDNDFPMITKDSPVKNSAGLGYLQQYIAGMDQYQQGGTDVPDFGVRSDYAQGQGGPLISRTIRYTPPNAIIKAPALDSPYMDELIKRGFQPLTPPRPKGPQLPSFL